jgi:protein-tyrosine-phosphatase
VPGDQDVTGGGPVEPVAGGAAAPDVLVVCTANIARSPLLAARLRLEADRRLGAGMVVVGSAGIDARFGDGAASGSRRVVERWGASLDGHLAQPTMYVPIQSVPLVITMTRRHLRALVARHPGAAATTFTVAELVGCVETLQRDNRLPAATVTSRPQLRARIELTARLANGHRPAFRSLRRSLDIPDPIGGSQADYDRLGERFAAAGEILADALFGPTPD